MFEKHRIWASLLYAEVERGNSLESLYFTINFDTTNPIVSTHWVPLLRYLWVSFVSLSHFLFLVQIYNIPLSGTCFVFHMYITLSGLSLFWAVFHWCYVSAVQTYLMHYSNISWVGLFRCFIQNRFCTKHSVYFVPLCVLWASLKFIADFLDKVGQVIILPASCFPSIKWSAQHC